MRHSISTWILGCGLLALTQPALAQKVARLESTTPAATAPNSLDAAIARHAQINGVPESLVRRVIMRESRYNARVVSKGNYGLMQIKLATARGVGYTGTAAGLLDAETNLTYAVRYLAGAYKVAGGNHDRAVSYYARGYYYAAKRQGVPTSVFAQTPAPVTVESAQPQPQKAAAFSAGASRDLMSANRDMRY